MVARTVDELVWWNFDNDVWVSVQEPHNCSMVTSWAGRNMDMPSHIKSRRVEKLEMGAVTYVDDKPTLDSVIVTLYEV